MKSTRRWLVPGLCVLLAIAYTVVFLMHDQPMLAVIGAGVMLAFGLVLVIFSRRSETVALLREDAPDERRALITTKAAACTMYVMVGVSVVMAFVQLARGVSPGPWGVICSIGGAVFIVSLAYESRRS